MSRFFFILVRLTCLFDPLENIAKGFGSIGDVMTAWVEKEAPNWDERTATCKTGTICGHFTQVPWIKPIIKLIKIEYRCFTLMSFNDPFFSSFNNDRSCGGRRSMLVAE